MTIKKNPIQVLYILTKLELGGAQKVCLSLLKGTRNKCDFSGLISGVDGVLVDQVKQFDSVFLLKSFKREIGIKNVIADIKVFFQMIFLIRKLRKKYSNLIIHTHSTKAGIIGRWAAFFAGVKKRIHTVHGFGFHQHQSLIKWFIVYLLELLTSFVTTKYICVSKVDVATGVRFLPGFKKRSVVIRAAVDWDRFYIPAKLDSLGREDKFVIGSVSCFKPQKNLFDLLKAFKLICNNLDQKKSGNLILQIIGDGDLRKSIQSWIRQNNLEKNIELLGWQADVSKWMKSWKVFAMSSLWEGLPCAVVEARLSFLPIVAYNVGGISEVLLNKKNGFLIKAGDWKGLADKIANLIFDDALRKKMSLHSDNLLDFNDKVMLKKHLELYSLL